VIVLLKNGAKFWLGVANFFTFDQIIFWKKTNPSHFQGKNVPTLNFPTSHHQNYYYYIIFLFYRFQLKKKLNFFPTLKL
jgi:hypothetical protein